MKKTAEPGQADDEARYKEAREHLRTGRYKKAEQACRRLLKRNPGHPALLELQGLIALQQGQHKEAVRALQSAVSSGQPSGGLFNNLSLALASAGAVEEAIETAQLACAAKPEVAEFRINLGNRLRAAGKVETAIQAYQEALRLRPDLTAAHVGLGNAWASVGEGEQARDQYRQALDQQPKHVRAFYHLALSSKSGAKVLDQGILDRFHDLAEEGQLVGEEAVLVHSALGFLADLDGRYDEAFDHVRQSNEAAKAVHKPYDRAAHSRLVDRIIRYHPADRLRPTASAEGECQRPIFVLGMPRSGTTLVERILGAHKEIVAGGEIPLLGSLAESVRGYPEGHWRLSSAAASKLTAAYRAELGRLGGESPFVTDKMPQNFLHIGLIAHLFPGALVVHCRRDPMDTCLSCYFQNFTQGNAFARDLTDIGAYYKDYRRLMDHWKSTLDIAEVDYEALAADPKPVTRRLLDDLGLDWDPNCLSHEASRAPVATASQWQVRQKIHGKAVGRWRRYEQHLGPLLEALGPLATA